MKLKHYRTSKSKRLPSTWSITTTELDPVAIVYTSERDANTICRSLNRDLKRQILLKELRKIRREKNDRCVRCGGGGYFTLTGNDSGKIDLQGRHSILLTAKVKCKYCGGTGKKTKKGV